MRTNDDFDTDEITVEGQGAGDGLSIRRQPNGLTQIGIYNPIGILVPMWNGDHEQLRSLIDALEKHASAIHLPSAHRQPRKKRAADPRANRCAKCGNPFSFHERDSTGDCECRDDDDQETSS